MAIRSKQQVLGVSISMTNEEALSILKNTAWLGTEADRKKVEKAIRTLYIAERPEPMNTENTQPEIIRCKDCKHHWIHRCMDSMPTEICDLNQTFYDPNIDFCSLAERRTDEQT